MEPYEIWTIVGSNLAMMAVIFGSLIAMWLHTDSKIESSRKETNEIIKAMLDEMKDFHGRLCAIEERNRGK